MKALVTLTSKLQFTGFLLTFFASFATCQKLISQDSVSAGLITLHIDLIETPISKGFVPLRINDRFFICTPLSSGLTSKSKVGIETNVGSFDFAPLTELIEVTGADLGANNSFLTQSIERNLLFIPLAVEMPVNEKPEQLWKTIRDRAVDLAEVSKNIDIPKTASVFNYSLDSNGNMFPCIRSIGIKSIKEFYNVHRNPRTNEPLYHFELEHGLKNSDLGSIFLRTESLENGDAKGKFLGMCVSNFSAKDELDYYVMMHPLTILKLFEQHESRLANKQ